MPTTNRSGPGPATRRQFLGGSLLFGGAALLDACGSSRPHFPPAVAGPATTFTRAPLPTRRIALTIDDGYDDATLSAYLDLAEKSGLPLTFDAIGKLAPNWERHADRIKHLAGKGQVQIANHTFHHLDLRTLSDRSIRNEIQSNEEWIEKTFGVTSRPYLRPPNGSHDSRTDAIAGQLGFTRILLWQGSFDDSRLLDAPTLMENAQGALLPGAIVVGHANYPTVVSEFPKIMDLIRARGLVPVTVDTLCGTGRPGSGS